MGTDLLVSSMEKQVLFKRLCHRNAIRRQIGIRPMDVPTVFKRKLRMMTEQRYNDLLRPHLAMAFGSVEWPKGATARLLLAVKLHKASIDHLYREQSIADPRQKKPDMIKLMDEFIPTSVVALTYAQACLVVIATLLCDICSTLQFGKTSYVLFPFATT